MSRIVFFCIPAHGHTNPTIEVVKELSWRGHEVWYYSFNEFKEKIESSGAKFISCDDYLPHLKSGDEKKIGKDFSALIEMVIDTTLALDEKVSRELNEFKPDCIVSDSMCVWGKLFAEKLNVAYICSTTTFAFNEYTARLIKRRFSEIIHMILGMRRINKKLHLLNENGYVVDNFISLIKNDSDTDTIVYTSKEFQPMSETFSDKFHFIGPSVSKKKCQNKEGECFNIYISLGTINNKNIKFYRNCIRAFKNSSVKVIMSVGSSTEISELGHIPENFVVKNSVRQTLVLQNTDVFISHCGMNSTNESLYYGVPMIMFPQQSEQAMVARRVEELEAGIILKHDTVECIRNAVKKVMEDDNYKKSAAKLGSSFKKAGGAAKAADVIQALCL